MARERFNALVRGRYGADERFDVAAAESTEPDGQVLASLYPAYSSDGSHLNDTGSAVAAVSFLTAIRTDVTAGLCGVGIDVADVARFARLDLRYGERFRRRWFTEAELTQCDAASDRPSCLASRFAAKEAVWKALGLGNDEPLAWGRIAGAGP